LGLVLVSSKNQVNVNHVGADAFVRPGRKKLDTKPCAIISADPPSPEGSRTTREIDLATAISEIKHAPEETENGKSPFFIKAGAGISTALGT